MLAGGLPEQCGREFDSFSAAGYRVGPSPDKRVCRRLSSPQGNSTKQRELSRNQLAGLGTGHEMWGQRFLYRKEIGIGGASFDGFVLQRVSAAYPKMGKCAKGFIHRASGMVKDSSKFRLAMHAPRATRQALKIPALHWELPSSLGLSNRD